MKRFDYESYQKQYRETHRKEKSLYNKKTYKLDHEKDESVYVKPKMRKCICGRKTVNHYRCSVCLEELEIPSDCLGWEITANHMF